MSPRCVVHRIYARSYIISLSLSVCECVYRIRTQRILTLHQSAYPCILALYFIWWIILITLLSWVELFAEREKKPEGNNVVSVCLLACIRDCLNLYKLKRKGFSDRSGYIYEAVFISCIHSFTYAYGWRTQPQFRIHLHTRTRKNSKLMKNEEARRIRCQ